MSETERVMRASPFPMIEPEEATRLIFENVAAPGPAETEEVKLAEGDGRILAEDVYAGVDMPPFDTTAVDGYALLASDGQQSRRIIGEQTAGRIVAPPVVPGTAVRIMTGAPMPPGADSVIMVEFTSERDGVLEVEKASGTGDNIRPRAQDLETGQLVLSAGTLIGPAEIGLIATVNRPTFKAYRRPRIAVVSTGDEIVEPGNEAGPGQIYDSNRFSIMSALRRAYADPVSLGIAPDTEAGLRSLIHDALANYDGLITSGGVSVGKLDLVKDLLEEIGTIHFGRVNLKPGKPLTFVTVRSEGRDKPVFGLPGFPVSSLVSFELFVRPAILKLGGRTRLQRPVVQVQLEHDVKHSPDRNEFVRAIVSEQYDGQAQAYRYSARTTGAQNSSRLLSMLGANALLRLAPGESLIKAGSYVPALLIDRPEV
ncbi:MAG TPA: gephyrin-like molybdotransferase Glp [Chloroflexia bacterium]|nr:gephyrin-like molybdotransferase Glp [Chloroflexia bacterium]